MTPSHICDLKLCKSSEYWQDRDLEHEQGSALAAASSATGPGDINYRFQVTATIRLFFGMLGQGNNRILRLPSNLRKMATEVTDGEFLR